jgi:hypothetical protein
LYGSCSSSSPLFLLAILWSEHILIFYREIELELHSKTSSGIKTGTEFQNKEKRGEKFIRGETELRV